MKFFVYYVPIMTYLCMRADQFITKHISQQSPKPAQSHIPPVRAIQTNIYSFLFIYKHIIKAHRKNIYAGSNGSHRSALCIIIPME